jgi:drug/metabolite transporter (DMT)-like permease
VQVGAAIVVSRFAVGEVRPLTLAMLRYAIGFLCLLPFALSALRRLPRMPPTRDLAAMAALGTGQFGILVALLNWGLRTVPAAPAALLFGLFPLLTLLLSAAFGSERLTPALLAGVLLSIAGAALPLAPKLQAGTGGAWWGEAAVLASAGVGALCSVLYRPYLRRYPTVPISAFAMLASVLFLAVIALGEDWPHRVRGLSPAAWAAVSFVGLSSGIGYFCWLYALKHEPPTRVTVFLSLNPVTAALLGWAFLGEPLTPRMLAALALIALGLWLATRPASGSRQAAPG